MSNKSPNNPYAAGASAYAQQLRVGANDPREVEANALLNANRKMQALQARWETVTPAELEEVLRFNRQIWMIFVDAATQNSNNHPLQLRNNIANLGLFVFKHSIEIAAAPEKEKLDALISINLKIATGLMSKPQQKKDSGDQSSKSISWET